MRREWIEMTNGVDGAGEKIGLPPCGGSGLKYRNYVLFHTLCCLPPCGGSGLKCAGNESCERNREVSLHAEGVD